MTLKSGDLNNNENSGEKKISTTDADTLKDLVFSLQKELKEIKQTQAVTQSGIDPVMMAKIIAEFSVHSKKTEDLDYSEGISSADIPVDDYDEEGITFCAPFSGYAISDDRRKGHVIRLPYNKKFIFFNYEGERIFQQGKHAQKLVFSVYRSQSKEEIKWLREHTFFNTMFYESTKGMANFDVQRAQKLARIMTMLTNFELPSIISRCKEYNVPINQDIAVMRSMLAMEMSKRELESEQSHTQRRLAEIEKEKKLLMSERQ